MSQVPPVQFPIPGPFQLNGGGPRYNPTFDGQFASGTTTSPYINGLLDMGNQFQNILFTNPIFSGTTGTDGSSGGTPGAGTPTPGNPTGGTSTTGPNGLQFPIPGPFQLNGGGPRYNPTFDGQFASGTTTSPYINGLLDLGNQFQNIIFSSPNT